MKIDQTTSHGQEPTAPTRPGRPRPAGGGAGGSRLEIPLNNRKLGEEEKQEEPTHVDLHRHGCRCRTCPTCGPKYGKKVRFRLMSKAEQFTRPALLTLTVDRSHYGSPLDAYLIITGGGYVRRLMRLLGVKRWAWTLELQMKTGEGWPHWHLVIDLPPGGLDLKRAWRLWRDKWELGGLDLQRKKNKNARHALLYVTKYLTKYPEEGFPDWILHLDRRVRWVGACGDLGPVVSDREKTAVEASTPEQAESMPREHRSLATRMSECGELVVFLRREDPEDETSGHFYGRLPRELVESAYPGLLTIERPPDEGPPYLRGPWESFADLAGHLNERATRADCTYAWTSRRRWDLARRAGELTRKGGPCGDGIPF